MYKPTMVDDDGDIVINYRSCPIKFVPDSVWEFVKMRTFYQKYPSSPFPKYDNVSPRYLKAESTLEHELMVNSEVKS